MTYVKRSVLINYKAKRRLLRSIIPVWTKVIHTMPHGQPMFETHHREREPKNINPYSAELFCLNDGDQSLFAIWNHYKCLS